MNIEIDGQPIPLETLKDVCSFPVHVQIGCQARLLIQRAQAFLQQELANNRTLYGINTGFGKLVSVRIDRKQQQQLQENLIRSHAVGVGELLPNHIVRLAMFLKVRSLASGLSGVRESLIDSLTGMINQEIYPQVPSQGSVGASGDLAPLAHIAQTLIGEGKVTWRDQTHDTSTVFNSLGWESTQLQPKEGLALLNGTEVSTAIALSALFRSERTLSVAILAGAMSVDSIKGSDTPFDERILAARGHDSQLAIGTYLRKLLDGSEIRDSHRECDRVQDPYSIRCQPQVLGACLHAIRHVAEVLAVEANSVTDNPLVLAADNEVMSGGNFHGEPIAMVADYLALALAEIGAISERRIALMIDPQLSNLPAFLVENSGLNSGFMIAQVTAAALASENKSLAQSVSIDSIPTSLNQEDHVSMATYAARRLHQILDNVNHIIAIELLAAAQGIEFHRPNRSSDTIETAISQIRSESPRLTVDRSLANDIRTLASSINGGDFSKFVDVNILSKAT